MSEKERRALVQRMHAKIRSYNEVLSWKEASIFVTTGFVILFSESLIDEYVHSLGIVTFLAVFFSTFTAWFVALFGLCEWRLRRKRKISAR